MFKAKDELQLLEEKFKHFENQSHKIGFKDIDVLLRKMGVSLPKKNIEVDFNSSIEWILGVSYHNMISRSTVNICLSI